jgi:hypothetical protein
MAGPWEKFQAASENGPWSKFQPPKKERWERAILLPMETNLDTGERRLAWPQIAVDIGGGLAAPGKAARGEYGLEIDPDTGRPTTISNEMIKDTMALSAIPAMGGTAGPTIAAAEKFTGPILTGRARSLVTRGLDDAGIPINQAGPRMQEIGPDAVLADLAPRLQGQAQAIATMPGPGQQTVVDALRFRAAGRDARIMGDVNDTLGPATTPTQFQTGIKDAKTALSPEYQKAFANARAVDTGDVALGLESIAVNARGEAQAVANQIRSMLNVAGTDQLDPNPQTLFEVRKAIDGMFDTVQDGNARRVLSETRKQVDGLLSQAVPGIKEVDAKFAALAKKGEAFDTGQTILDSGRTALRPPEVESIVRTATPDVLEGLSAGARAEVDRIIGTTANDLVALKRALGGEGDWNRARLAAVFGQDKADRLLQVVAREMRYKALEDPALGGSRTQVLKAGQDEMNGVEPKAGVIQSIADFKPGTAVRVGLDKGLGWAFRANRSATNAAVADALMSRYGADLINNLPYGGQGAVTKGALSATAKALLARGEAPWTKRAPLEITVGRP